MGSRFFQLPYLLQQTLPKGAQFHENQLKWISVELSSVRAIRQLRLAEFLTQWWSRSLWRFLCGLHPAEQPFLSERLQASSGCPREVISPLPSTTTPSLNMGPRLFSPRTEKIGPFLSLFLHQQRPCSWPHASPLVPGERLGLPPPRAPAPYLARVIPKCMGGSSWSLGETEDEAGVGGVLATP